MQDRTEIGDGTETLSDATETGLSLEFSEAELKVADILTETIISVAPHESVEVAIQKMGRYKISCIIVVSAGSAVGILTERDVLRGVATRCSAFVRATVAEEMSHPVISVDPHTTVLAANKLMASRNIKRLLVVRGRQPVGVVTQTDITSALISMSPLRDIAALMTRDVVTVAETATMAEAAQLMAARNISCVVIVREGKATGIVTEKDVVRRVALSRQDPRTTPVTEIMSFPVVSVSPTHSVMSTSRMMDQMRIHRLLVGSVTDIQGIVTQTDIIAAVQDRLEEMREVQWQRRSDMGLLASSALTNLSSIQSLVREILGHHRFVGESAKTADFPENAPSPRSAISDCDQGEAAWHDRTLQELEARMSEAQDSLARLVSMVADPTSQRSAVTTADDPLELSEAGG